MMKFFKAQASSLMGTGVDFLIVYLLSERAGAWYFGANVLSTLAGGITNFTINRWWVFKKENERIERQVFRYSLTWVGNMLLNSAGIQIVLHYTGLHHHYMLVKILVALLIGFTYSYAMQKRFVFK